MFRSLLFDSMWSHIIAAAFRGSGSTQNRALTTLSRSLVKSLTTLGLPSILGMTPSTTLSPDPTR